MDKCVRWADLSTYPQVDFALDAFVNKRESLRPSKMIGVQVLIRASGRRIDTPRDQQRVAGIGYKISWCSNSACPAGQVLHRRPSIPSKLCRNSVLTKIAKRLVLAGKRSIRSQAVGVEFTGEPAADKMLNNLATFPHAFVLGCVMDRQISTKRAWRIPYSFREKLGTFRFSALKGLSLPEIEHLMSTPVPLHRFPARMSEAFHSAVQRIADDYDGNAAKIWSDNPSSAEVIYRFLKFKGVGPKIASMAVNILARNFKVRFNDYHSIDVSVDVQVRRVLTRLHLIEQDEDLISVIYRVRALNPQFPGLIDLPAWEIGRHWCRPREPLCSKCYMADLCPSAQIR